MTEPAENDDIHSRKEAFKEAVTKALGLDPSEADQLKAAWRDPAAPTPTTRAEAIAKMAQARSELEQDPGGSSRT